MCVEIAGDDSLGLLDVKVVEDVVLPGVGDTAFEGTLAVGFNRDDEDDDAVEDVVVAALLTEDVPCAIVDECDPNVVDVDEEEEEARAEEAREAAVGLWREDDLTVVVGDEAPDDDDDTGDDVLVLESEDDAVVAVEVAVDLRLVEPTRWLDDVAERWLDDAVGA